MPHMDMPSMCFRIVRGFDRCCELIESRYYCLSILDKHHHPDIDFEKGMQLVQMCADELKRRLPIDFKGVSSE